MNRPWLLMATLKWVGLVETAASPPRCVASVQPAGAVLEVHGEPKNATPRAEEMVLYGENDRMSEAREVVERFYERFGEGDMTEAFALFAADYISLTPSGSLNNEKHEAVARNLKHAIPDGHMEMIHTLESGGEIFVNGRFMGTHRNDLSTPFGTIVASNNRLTCSSPTTSEWRAEKSLSVGPYGIGSVSLPSSGVPSGRT